MTTLGDLVNDIQQYLYGFGLDRDKETYLTTALAVDDTAFQVYEPTQVDRGLVEIDGELIQVYQSTKDGIVLVPPYGRGMQNSTAAPHAQGARVVSNPAFPRARIRATINMILSDMYPELYGVATDSTNRSTPTWVTYPLDASAESIVSMSVQLIGPSKMWRPITRYRLDRLADTTAFPSGRSVDIYESLPPGRTIKIIYRTQFGTFGDDESATLDSVNVDEGYRDIIALGVEAKLLPTLDVSRLSQAAVESVVRAQGTQPGQATAVARDLFQRYQLRIQDERRRLANLYPGSVVRMS